MWTFTEARRRWLEMPFRLCYQRCGLHFSGREGRQKWFLSAADDRGAFLNDASLLREIVRVSGDQFNASPESVFDRQDETATRHRPLWPWPLSAAGLLLVLDVALRRVEFTLRLPGKWPAVRSVRPEKSRTMKRPNIPVGDSLPENPERPCRHDCHC
jgi:hypothetical protein